MKIKGMMCGHCEARVKSALEAIDGVCTIDVSYKSGTAKIKLTDKVDMDTLVSAVTEQGYKFKGFSK